jgi:hypothetical protein
MEGKVTNTNYVWFLEILLLTYVRLRMYLVKRRTKNAQRHRQLSR